MLEKCFRNKHRIKKDKEKRTNEENCLDQNKTKETVGCPCLVLALFFCFCCCHLFFFKSSLLLLAFDHRIMKNKAMLLYVKPLSR